VKHKQAHVYHLKLKCNTIYDKSKKKTTGKLQFL